MLTDIIQGKIIMPVKKCRLNGKPGYRWGSKGKCYIYSPGNESSRKKAKYNAHIQGGMARKAGYKG